MTEGVRTLAGRYPDRRRSWAVAAWPRCTKDSTPGSIDASRSSCLRPSLATDPGLPHPLPPGGAGRGPHGASHDRARLRRRRGARRAASTATRCSCPSSSWSTSRASACSRTCIARGPLGPGRRAARIVDGHPHRARVLAPRRACVHRDIKPGNVMIAPSGQVKVMDFGIARAISESPANVAQTSARRSAPRVLLARAGAGRGVDARTDLYSTGVVLYELLTGRPPFRGDSSGRRRVPARERGAHAAERDQTRRSRRRSSAVVHARASPKDRFERFQSARRVQGATSRSQSAARSPIGAPGGDDFNAHPVRGRTRSSSAGIRGHPAPPRRTTTNRPRPHAEPALRSPGSGAASPS